MIGFVNINYTCMVLISNTLPHEKTFTAYFIASPPIIWTI